MRRAGIDRELGIALTLVAIIYLSPTFRIPIRGEEPRWSQTATEMRRSGDWLVPHQQGTLFLSRPPLHVWTLAALQSLTGSDAPWLMRMPSVLSVLAVCVLIYFYVTSFAPPLIAAAAVLIFATLGEMMQLGSIAESDAPFVFFVAGSMLFWHMARLRQWSPVLGWLVPYLFVALAALCKGGPQPPIYFLVPVIIYLTLTGELRSLFHWGHALGIVLAAGLIALWVVPFINEVGPANARYLWGQDTAARLVGEWGKFVRHLVFFPLEVIGCTLPWLPLAGLFAMRSVREQLHDRWRPLLFCGLAMVVAFPTCWLPPGGETRYFAPLYPCLAIVLVLAAEAAGRAQVVWQPWTWLVGLAVGMCGAAVIGLSLGRARPLGEPLLGMAIIGGGLIAVAWILARTESARSAFLAIAIGAALINAGWLTGIRARRSPNLAANVAEVRGQLGEGTRLVSYDLLPSVFVYHYGDPIAFVSPPTTRDEFERAEAFAVTVHGTATPALPGQWVEVARVGVERNVRAGGRVVVIGRPVRRPAAVRVTPCPAGAGAVDVSRSVP